MCCQAVCCAGKGDTLDEHSASYMGPGLPCSACSPLCICQAAARPWTSRGWWCTQRCPGRACFAGLAWPRGHPAVQGLPASGQAVSSRHCAAAGCRAAGRGTKPGAPSSGCARAAALHAWLALARLPARAGSMITPRPACALASCDSPGQANRRLGMTWGASAAGELRKTSIAAAVTVRVALLRESPVARSQCASIAASSPSCCPAR